MPGELLRENKTVYSWKDHRCNGYMINRAFAEKKEEANKEKKKKRKKGFGIL